MVVILFMFIGIPFNTVVSYGKTIGVSASSAIVMDVTTGRVLYEKNMNEKKPMASTTKIMTALLALEKTDLDSVIKIPKNAVGVEGSSIYLKNNESLKMKDLLYGLMLRSGNDAAVAIASSISGSTEKFAQLMNEKAEELGAKHTHFVNPHGLHHKDHYTCAYDLALITRAALKNKDFNNIVKTKLWVADRDGYKYFYNKNKTLTQLDGGDGVKIGYTKAAGRCLVTSATRNGMQLICVVLNDPNWFEDSYKLLDDAFEKYEPFSVMKKDTVLKRIHVVDGKKESTGVVSMEDVIIPVTREEKDKLITRLEIDENISSPLKRGEKLGKGKIYLKGKLLYTIDLRCREDIEVKTFKDKVQDLISQNK